jgi:hypothetical protein
MRKTPILTAILFILALVFLASSKFTHEQKVPWQPISVKVH